MTAPQGLSLLAIVNVLMRRRLYIVGAALALAALTGITRLVSGRVYTVDASYIIRSNNAGGAAGLAAQLGVDVGTMDVSQSPHFYAELVKTPDVLMRIADSLYATSDRPGKRTLAEIWDLKKDTPEMQRAAVVERLSRAVASGVGLKIDLISIRVMTQDPLLSKQLADAVLAEVNRFNLQTLQSRARAERRFSEARMAELQGELARAEDALRSFFEINRQPYLSPALDVEKARLTRKVELAQQTYGVLATSFERARIDEVRDTPLITVVETPRPPVRADPRGVISKSVLAFVLGLLGASLLALAYEALRWILASDDDEAREFHELVTDATRDLGRIRGVLRSRRNRVVGG